MLQAAKRADADARRRLWDLAERSISDPDN
jgi:hypothetical protein